MTSTYPIGTIGSVASLLAETHQEILIGTTSFRILDQWRDERYIFHMQVLQECCYIDMESLQWENWNPGKDASNTTCQWFYHIWLQWVHYVNGGSQCYIEYTSSIVEVKVTSSTHHQLWKSRLHWLHLINGGSQGYIDYTSSMEGVKITLITPHQLWKLRLHWLHLINGGS